MQCRLNRKKRWRFLGSILVLIAGLAGGRIVISDWLVVGLSAVAASLLAFWWLDRRYRRYLQIATDNLGNPYIWRLYLQLTNSDRP